MTFSEQALVGVLGWLLQYQAEVAKPVVDRVLPPIPPGEEPGRATSLAVAIEAAKFALGKYWPRIWAGMQSDSDWGEHIARRLGARFYNHGPTILRQLSDDQAGALLIWLLGQFPVEQDAELTSDSYGQGNAEWLRHDLYSLLESRGSIGACVALQRAIETYPQYAWWLNDVLLRAQANWRRQAWKPVAPEQLRRMFESRQSRYIAGPSQLLDVIVESLGRLESSLHGELPERVNLWDPTPNGKKPKDEESLSDHVARHLKSDLLQQGVVVNREVRIRRRGVSDALGGIKGEEPDIVVEAVSPSTDANPPDMWGVLLEVKGCWHREVRSAMGSQLVGRYLKQNASRQGLYLVGWFSSPAWDSADPRKTDVPWDSIDAAKGELYEQARVHSQAAKADVRAVVIDCSLP